MSLNSTDQKKYFSTREAAIVFGYTNDYISKLAREGKIEAKKIRKSWFIEESSLREFIKATDLAEEERLLRLKQHRADQYKKGDNQRAGLSRSIPRVISFPIGKTRNFNTHLIVAVLGFFVFISTFVVPIEVYKQLTHNFSTEHNSPKETPVFVFEKKIIYGENNFSYSATTLHTLLGDVALRANKTTQSLLIPIPESIEKTFDINTPKTMLTFRDLHIAFLDAPILIYLSSVELVNRYIESITTLSRSINKISVLADQHISSAMAFQDRFVDHVTNLWIDRVLIRDELVLDISNLPSKFFRHASVVLLNIRNDYESKVVFASAHIAKEIDSTLSRIGRSLSNNVVSVQDTFDQGPSLFASVIGAFTFSPYVTKTSTVEYSDSFTWFEQLQYGFRSLFEKNPPSEEQMPTQEANRSVATTTVVERVVDRTPTTVVNNITEAITVSGISSDELTSRLQALENALRSEIYLYSARADRGISGNYRAIGLTNVINNLDGVTIRNATIIGGSISGTSGIGGGGASDLDDLSDVTIASPVNGQVLLYDGSIWNNVATSSLGITGSGSSFGQAFEISGGYLAPTTTQTTLLSGGFVSQASSTVSSLSVTNGTTTNATTTTLAITSIASSLLKTATNGVVSAAVAGVDYITDAFREWTLSTNTFGQSALAPTTTQNIAVSGVGTSTFAGGLEAWRQIGAPYFNATSTSATSTFAGGLAVSGGLNLFGTFGNSWDDFCTSITGGSGLCDGTDNAGGGAGLATSTDILDTYVIYGTSASDVGAEASFTYDDATDRLTLVNASTTNISASYASSTQAFFGSLNVGSLTGLLRATAGVVATATIDLVNDVGSSILAVANGGTGWAELQANTLLLGNGTGRVATTSAGTNGQILSLVSGVPSWVSTTTFSGGLTYSAGNVTADLGTSISAAEIADGDHGFFSYTTGVASLDTGGLTSANLAASLTNESGATGVFPLFSLASQAFGDLVSWNGTNWVNTATSTLNIAFANLVGTASDSQVDNNLTISGGTIENTPIGAVTPSTGVFTNATSTNATTTNIAVSGTATTSALVVSNSFRLQNLTGLLRATAGVVATATIDLVNDVGSSILAVANGGTGWAELQANTLLLGNGTSRLATTSAGTNGQILSLVSGVPSWVSTTTFSGGLTYSAGNVTADLGTSIDISSETNLAVSATGLELSGDTIALSTGYSIPLTASTTNWNSFYDTPSTRITAGTGLSWAGNTLNATGGSSFGQAFELTSNTFSQSALAPTTTQNLLINGTGTSTFAGGLEAWRQIGAPYFHATSTATSTLTRLTGSLISGFGLSECADAADKLIWNNGLFSCGADAGAGGGITALGAQYSSFQTGSSQTFATSSDTNLGLTITSSGDTHTFTPTWTGTLTATRGGTGLATIASSSLLIGGAGNTWLQFATSSLGIAFADVTGSVTDAQVDNNLTISGGTIENTPIGAVTPSTGVFTNATSTNATTTNIAVSGTATTSALVVSNSFRLQNLTGLLRATAGVVATATIDLVNDVGSSILAVANGGTGWANLQANTLLLGNGTSRLATTSAGTNGQILSLVSGVPSWVSTTTFSGGLTYSAGNVTADLGTSISAAEIADGDHGFFSYTTGVASLDTGGLTSANLAASLTNESGATGVFPLFSLASQAFGDLVSWNGTNWVNTATSTLNIAFANLVGTASDSQVDNNLTISGGTIENTPIGAATPSTGVFTNATSTNATTTNIAVSGTATTSALVVSNSFRLQNLTGLLRATAGVVATATIDLVNDVGSSILAVANGGTGWAELQANTLLLGNGTGRVATTSAGTNGQILSLVSGVPSWVATTTFNTPLNYAAGAVTLDTSGTWSGTASLASALAANGANCSAGNAPLGVDASGAVEGCFDIWTEAENTSAAYAPQSRSLTIAGTANQITSSAGAQDLSGDRTWTLSIPSLFSIQLASTTGLSALGNLYAGNGSATTTIQGNATSTFGAGIEATYLNITGTAATSTFARGIDLAGGCFAINGVCIGGGSGSPGGSDGQLQYNNGGSFGGASSVYYDDVNNLLGIGSTSPWAKLAVNPVAGDTNQFVVGSSTATSFLIDSAGRVGVGTTTPGGTLSSRFSINGTASVFASLDFTDATTRGTWFFTEGSVTKGFVQQQGSATAETSRNGNLEIGTLAGAGSVSLWTNALERFRITPTGNVGIGTTSPAVKLEIAGSASAALRIDSTAVADFSDLYVGSGGFLVLDNTQASGASRFIDLRPGSANHGLVLRESDGTGTATYANFYVTDATVDYMNIVINAAQSTTGLVISDADHVGVGTTTPWKTLSVTETVADAQLALAYDTTRYATFQVTSVGDLVIEAQGDDVSLLDENLYVCTGGSCPSGPAGTGNLLVENIFVAPQGTAPTVSSAGAIAIDTSGDDMLLVADEGGTARAVPLKQKIWSVTVASTSPAFIAAGLLPIPVQLDGYTMTDIRCKVDTGTSKVIAVEDASANSTEDITCATSVTSDDGSITNATATAAEEMYIDFGATSGSVDYVTITVYGYWTRE